MEMNKLMTMVGMRKGMLQWRTKQSNMSDLRRARMHPVFWLRSCVDVPLRIDACRKECSKYQQIRSSLSRMNSGTSKTKTFWKMKLGGPTEFPLIFISSDGSHPKNSKSTTPIVGWQAYSSWLAKTQ